MMKGKMILEAGLATRLYRGCGTAPMPRVHSAPSHWPWSLANSPLFRWHRLLADGAAGTAAGSRSHGAVRPIAVMQLPTLRRWLAQQGAAGIKPHRSANRDRHVTSLVPGGFYSIMGTKSWENRVRGGANSARPRRFRGLARYSPAFIRLPPFACPNLPRACPLPIESGVAEAFNQVIRRWAHRAEAEPWGRRMEASE